MVKCLSHKKKKYVNGDMQITNSENSSIFGAIKSSGLYFITLWDRKQMFFSFS